MSSENRFSKFAVLFSGFKSSLHSAEKQVHRKNLTINSFGLQGSFRQFLGFVYFFSHLFCCNILIFLYLKQNLEFNRSEIIPKLFR